MNTAIHYQYRDGSNYKCGKTEVFVGEITDRQRRVILGALEGGEHFIAEQVGLANMRETWHSHFEDDSIWHEFEDDPELVEGPATTGVTIAEFAEKFHNVIWDVATANARLEAWKESTPVGQ